MDFGFHHAKRLFFVFLFWFRFSLFFFCEEQRTRFVVEQRRLANDRWGLHASGGFIDRLLASIMLNVRFSFFRFRLSLSYLRHLSLALLLLFWKSSNAFRWRNGRRSFDERLVGAALRRRLFGSGKEAA